MGDFIPIVTVALCLGEDQNARLDGRSYINRVRNDRRKHVGSYRHMLLLQRQLRLRKISWWQQADWRLGVKMFGGRKVACSPVQSFYRSRKEFLIPNFPPSMWGLHCNLLPGIRWCRCTVYFVIFACQEPNSSLVDQEFHSIIVLSFEAVGTHHKCGGAYHCINVFSVQCWNWQTRWDFHAFILLTQNYPREDMRKQSSTNFTNTVAGESVKYSLDEFYTWHTNTTCSTCHLRVEKRYCTCRLSNQYWNTMGRVKTPLNPSPSSFTILASGMLPWFDWKLHGKERPQGSDDRIPRNLRKLTDS